ncbi:hypothetical protein A2Y85_00740 [candidate division WOR-3 bacterium RBG_13_43_14]|uniref:POTRA domain-containing protein n=1 Tax=candidate division WOR-3 bacterium RBG_13_43_14 TaxID=1802590 RepID=A0A1F4U8L8_UNCW3|nr:MAG: hypothetical protein A2Y85_00740 [candidate division WOR-3 bacterium RBG_13_43_14]
MITIIVLLLAGTIIILRLSRHREKCILLEEVIPDASIIDQEEGIIEYNGIRFILGVNNLELRKRLIDSLELFNLSGSFTVDLKFDNQIIIRKESGLNNGSDENGTSLRRN